MKKHSNYYISRIIIKVEILDTKRSERKVYFEVTEKSIAWLISNLRTNEFAELFNTELASTRMRAGVCISGANNGMTVLPPNYRESSRP